MKRLAGLYLMGFIFLSTTLFSQTTNIYTVQLGTFVNAKASDFEAIRPLGMIYAQKLDNNLYRVYLGGYESAAKADQMAAQMQKRGYASASTVEIPVDENKTVIVIQYQMFKAKQEIDWEKYDAFENVFAIISEDAVKLVTGPFTSVDDARQELDRIKQAGFSDAFVKRVSTAYLHRISTFETGIKQPLIPLDLTAGEPAANNPAQGFADPATTAQGAQTTVKGAVATPTNASYLPDIRNNVKRSSVVELQKALKEEGVYQGALDGLYGPGTASAYQKELRQNRDLQKYRVLAQNINLPTPPGSDDQVQKAIDDLLKDSQAQVRLAQANNAIGKAYQSYFLFTAQGPGSQVNSLMNAAITSAYAGKTTPDKAPFDYNATYAYNNIDQVLQHLLYIHTAPGVEYAVPCWLFDRHPVEARRALVEVRRNSDNKIYLQSCDPFLEWEETRLALAIAFDLNGDQKIEVEPLAAAANERANLYLASQPLTAAQKTEVDAWSKDLWANLNGWATIDPLHERLVNAFRVAYYQTQVRLEDFYMDKGFKIDEASNLARATMKSLVGPHLERFV